jgi:putative intracellular protease/amidase
VTVLIPLPALDFDPTEVAVSWKVLSDFGHEVRFATPDGHMASADELMVTGEVRDWNYLSARWPGDAHTFAKRFAAMLDEPS